MVGERIAIFEDDPSILRMMTRILQEDEYIVALKAVTMDEAELVIQNLEDEDIRITIIDGNLSENNVSGKDGEYIARLIKEKYPNILTIGMSASPRGVEGVDVNIGKVAMHKSLVATIKEFLSSSE
ncbi:hypothetical protein KW795_01390 [Candidatus Microgenomates bacterium]|nr:hypothetical protein [Candidatus Microgenomates bacterium]